MAFNFSGKKALVTGAGMGIGRGIALALANAGCKVFALDFNEESLDSLTAEHTNVVKVVQDLSNWDETKTTLEKLDTVDYLVNNAAVYLGMYSALDHTKEDLDKYINVNLLAVINCTQVIAKKMVDAKKGGAIVNLSSVASSASFPNSLGYTITKAGVDMVTKQFALELGPHNIRINSVNPTLIRTNMSQSIIESGNFEDNAIERTPMRKVGEVNDVTGPVLYLLSDYAALVTGTMHVVDGGYTCNLTTKV